MKIIDKILNFCASRVMQYGAPYRMFGIFGIINYPSSYIVCSNYVGGFNTESFALRMLATILCLILVLKDKLPEKFNKFLPLYWYITVTLATGINYILIVQE